jgi:autotransporter-associated beta strand protein
MKKSLHITPHLPVSASRLLPGRAAGWVALLTATAWLAQPSPACAQNTWTTGGSPDTNWNNTANWSSGAEPQTYDTVLFGNTPPPPGVANGVIDNALDKSYTIAAFQYQTASTNGGGYHTTLIPAGLSLDINGSGGYPISVGTGIAQNNESIYSRLVGGGTLTITNTTGTINVVQVGANADHYATLDLSGLTNFAGTVDQVLVGAFTFVTGGPNRPMGIMRLAETNYLQTSAGTAKPGIMVGAYPGSDTNVRGTQQLFLGQHNVINSDVISMGGHKSTGQILSRTGVTNGYAEFRGSAGGTDRVKLMTVGDPRARIVDLTGGGTSTASTGTFNTTGTYLDLAIVDLIVARSQTTGTGNSTGTLTYDQGTIDADNLYIGYHETGTTSAANATGTVNVNGTAALNVAADLTLARKTGTNVPVGAISIASNATVTVGGNLVSGGGTVTVNLNGLLGVKGNIATNGGSSTWNLNGAVNLQPAGDPAPGTVTIGVLTGSGTVSNAASIMLAGSVTPGGAATVGTLNLGNNVTLGTGAALNVNLSSSGSGANDLINVAGNLTLNNNTVNLGPTGNSLSGSYRLFNYTGTQTGTLNVSNTTRYTASVSYGSGTVDWNITGGAPSSVKWNSLASAAWDLATSNWMNTGSSTVDRYFQLDSVLVNDSGAFTNLLLLSTAMYPSNVTVNSSTRDYSFGGSGRISGGASLVKLGTSMLTLSNANDFLGPVTVSAGTLKLANATALGTTNGGTTIASGATLDLNGQATYNPGEFITIAGTGLSSTGAVINTGAGQNNAIRFLTLADHSTVRADNRWDVRGPGGNNSFSGLLDLRGYTLTKFGAAQMSLVDAVVTNAGSIMVGGGILSITRSKIDGPGYIEALTNTVMFENSGTGYVAKAISFAGTTNGTLRVTGNATTLGAPITNAAGLTIDLTANLTLTGTIYGAGGVTKSGAAALILDAPQAYTGPTTVSAGRLTVSTNGSIASTPSLSMVAGSSLDVSAVTGGFTLSGSQTLSGTASVLGDMAAAAGANLVPGGNVAGTLTFSNNLTLNGVTNAINLGADPTQIGLGNSLIAVSSNLTLTGVNTILIKPIATLSTTSPYTVMTYTNALIGGLENLRVVSSNPRYSFSVVDPATTPGSIQVSVSGVPTTLAWRGGAAGNPNAWDTATTANWLSGVSLDMFYAGDAVTFDDTATTSVVSLAGTQQPGTVAVANNSLHYSIGGTGSLIAGALSKSGSASLLVTNNAANTFAGAVTTSGGAVTLANGGANTFVAGLVNDGSTVTLANPAANTFSQPVVLSAGSLVFDQAVDATFSAVLRDDGVTSGALEKRNNSTLTVSGNNTNFSGPISVSAGTFKAGNTYALGNSNSATTIASGATLDINGTSLYNPGDDVIISGFGLSNTGAVINTGAAQQNAIRSLILSNNAAIASWTSANRWDVRGPGGSGSFSGNLDLNGFALTKLGAGTNGIVDAYVVNAGVINIAGGTLYFTRCSVPAAGTVNVSSNALVFENYSAGNFSMPVTAAGGTIRLLGGAFSFDSPVSSLAGGLILDDSSGNNLTAAGDITGPGNLTKTGSSTVVLTSVNNAWSGNTVISAGTLQIGSGAGDGSLPDLPILNNATLVFNSQNNFTNTAGISGTGALTQTAGGTVTLTASNSFTGAVAMSTTTANSPSGSALRIANAYALGTTNGNTAISGNLTGNSTLELVGNITVPETFSLSARQGGTVDIPHIRNVEGSNTLTGPINGTTGGNAYNLQSDAGKLTVAGNFVPPSAAGARNLKLMGDGNGEWSGIISNSADGLVPALLIKQGAGTWTLSGSNVSFGATTITAGTLALAATGSINSTPSIDVQSNATLNVSAVLGGFTLAASQTLRGDGIIIGNLTANGTVTPGESIGTLTFSNNVVLSGTTIMEINRNTGTPLSDLIVAHAVTLGGTLVVTNLADPLTDPFVLGDSFKLLDAATLAGRFTTFVLPELPAGMAWDVYRLPLDGTIRVVTPAFITPGQATGMVVGGLFEVAWSTDQIGWSLLTQTNGLDLGVSRILADWSVVPGSTTTNRVFLPISPSKPAGFYRLTYP